MQFTVAFEIVAVSVLKPIIFFIIIFSKMKIQLLYT